MDMQYSINKDLQKAVFAGWVHEVKQHLSEGANVNHLIKRDKNTVLHLVKFADVAEELLLRGANVHARNIRQDTPLHCAINHRKGLDIVRLLLRHGSNVNAHNYHGNTPLNIAVKKRTINLGVVKELLEYGADINIRNYESIFEGNDSTSLDNAVDDLECAKLLIKFTLIKNLDRDYRKIIDLNPYKECSTYCELTRYLEHCVSEIIQMKKDRVNDGVSVLEFIITRNPSRKLYTFNEGVKGFPDQVFVILTNYTVYHDIISSKIKLGLVGLEREILLNKLSELRVYTLSDISNQDVVEKMVILDSYSTYGIAKYLSNDDLINVIMVFYDYNKVNSQSLGSSNNLAELKGQSNTRLDEASTSSCTKKAKLELP